jgi:aminocarboxymuconate-semialdehyde decarboxylase
MNHAWRERPDCRTVIKKKPTTYLEKFYFDTIVFDPAMLKNMVNRYGAEHVVLGTDYPFDMGMYDPVGFVQRTPLSGRERAQIVGGNAARLLKIDYNRSRRSKS